MPKMVLDLFRGIEGRLVNLNPRQITNRFRIQKQKLGYGFGFHDLRHYQASILHALGWPDKYIMKRGGWKTNYAMDKFYKDTFDKTALDLNKTANSHFQALLSENELKK